MSQYSTPYIERHVKASTRGGTFLPWWARESDLERLFMLGTLYEGPVPFDVVQEQLAGWEPRTERLLDEALVIEAINGGHAGHDLLEVIKQARVDSHKLIKTPEGNDVIGIDHAIHLFGEWLTGSIAEILGDEVQIMSSGNLDKMMQAWVCVERPEVVNGPAGIQFSPAITLSSSYNGTYATQINQNTTIPICDNTSDLARGQGTAFKHTKNSNARLGDYRSVLQALKQGETDFTKILEEMVSTPVSDKDMSRFLERYIPEEPEDGSVRRRNRSNRVRQEITQLYKGDDRVKEWRGTMFGLYQAVNTWQTHLSQLRNTTDYEYDDTNLRAQRNYANRMRPAKAKKIEGVKSVRDETPDDQTLRILRDVLGDDHKRTLVSV